LVSLCRNDGTIRLLHVRKDFLRVGRPVSVQTVLFVNTTLHGAGLSTYNLRAPFYIIIIIVIIIIIKFCAT